MAGLGEIVINEAMKGVAKDIVLDVNDAITNKVVNAAEDIPVLGDGIKTIIHKYNATKANAGKFLDYITSKAPKQHRPKLVNLKPDFLKNYDHLSAHNKLYNDLDISVEPGKNALLKKTHGSSLSKKLLKRMYNTDKSYNPEYINPDGTFTSKMTEADKTIIRDRIGARTRRGYDINAPHPLDNEYKSGPHNKFSASEQRILNPNRVSSEFEQRMPAPSETQVQAPTQAIPEPTISEPASPGLPSPKPQKTISDVIPESQTSEPSEFRVPKKPEIFSDENAHTISKFLPSKDLDSFEKLNKDVLKFSEDEIDQINSKEDLSKLTDKKISDLIPKNDIEKSSDDFDEFNPQEQKGLRWAKNLRTGKTPLLITNAEDIKGFQMDLIQDYNFPKPIPQRIASFNAIAADTAFPDELPEGFRVLNDNIDIQGLNNLSPEDFAKFYKTKLSIMSEYLNPEDAANIEFKQEIPKGKDPEFTETEEVPKPTPSMTTRMSTPSDSPPLSFNPNSPIQFTEDGEIQINHIPDLEKSKFEQLKQILTEAPDDLKEYIKDEWSKSTYLQLAGYAGTGAATVYGFYSRKKALESISQQFKGLDSDMKDTLGINDALLDGILNSYTPQNINNQPLQQATDSTLKLQNLLEQLVIAQSQQQKALQIFNQPSSSTITNNSNQKKLEAAEIKTHKINRAITNTAQKIKKQKKIADIQTQKLIAKQKQEDEQKQQQEDKQTETKPVKIPNGKTWKDSLNINIIPQQVQNNNNNPFSGAIKTNPPIQMLGDIYNNPMPETRPRRVIEQSALRSSNNPNKKIIRHRF